MNIIENINKSWFLTKMKFVLVVNKSFLFVRAQTIWALK